MVKRVSQHHLCTQTQAKAATQSGGANHLHGSVSPIILQNIGVTVVPMVALLWMKLQSKSGLFAEHSR